MMIDLLSQLQDEVLFSDVVTIPLDSLSPKELRIQLIEAYVHSCPAYFAIAIAANGRDDPPWTRAWHVAGGRSLDVRTARRAAVFEALERACLFHGGAEDRRVGTRASMLGRSYTTEMLAQYNSHQLLNNWANMQYFTTNGCGLSVDNLWMSARSLTRGDAVAVPAAVVLFPEVETAGPPLASSTGTAIRESVEGATHHALHELVERDAVAVWWYNRLVPHRLPAARSAALLPPALEAHMRERARLVWHLVLDTDLPAAVVVAVSSRADGTQPALGAAAAPGLEAAVCASTLEMLQVEVSLEQMRMAAEAGAIEPPPLLVWSNRADALGTAMLHGTSDREPAGPPPADAAALVAAMAAAGLDVVAVDLTRPEIGIPVVRVVSPHLRDWGPRFAPGRLYDLPVALGLRPAPLPEDELNEPFVL